MALHKRRERKHKARARQSKNAASGTPALQADSNAVELLPQELRERRLKHDEIKTALRAQQPRMSSKKQKRLDKYIVSDTKLRKEESSVLLKKLAGVKTDTSLLQSSKNLGKPNLSGRRAIDYQSNARRPRSPPLDIFSSERSEDEDPEPSIITGISTSGSTAAKGIHRIAQVDHSPLELGTGLKRPLEQDESGNPVIPKRPRLQKARHYQLSDFRTASHDAAERGGSDNRSDGLSDDDDEDSWSGFDQLSEADDNHSDSGSSVTTDHTSSSGGSSAEDELGFPLKPPFTHTVTERRQDSKFKAWAVQQINEAQDFIPSETPTNTKPTQNGTNLSKAQAPREEDLEPLPPELAMPLNTLTQRQVFSVHVSRSDKTQQARLELPIVSEEQRIMEAIHNHDIVIVTGSTGSGKTTQIPQFLYEAGYGSSGGPTPGLIGITQPRRVAAVTASKRVGEELGNAALSSYQIRFDSTIGKQTAIKFMTDGILIREIAQDFALARYSAIVIDEAHERSVNTDILIGMLSRIVDLRADRARQNPDCKPLKLIIMSATLMTEAFSGNLSLFKDRAPPLLDCEGRQYNVIMHFARRTAHDYVEECFRKITKGHRQLPPGTMLVFLTGQSEIVILMKRLKEALNDSRSIAYTSRLQIPTTEAPLEDEDFEIGHTEIDDLTFADEYDSSNESDEENDFKVEEPKGLEDLEALVLPLYSQMPTKEQLRVFQPPPANTRLIILATNVAETSVTIPGVRYVFDCGRSKDKRFDKHTGVQSFDIGWISKASAAQRAGRAGRTGPGHCYRLYSSAVFERDFALHTAPEILRVPADGITLQLKSMDLQNVVNFPFPTPPDRASIGQAEKTLAYLGALDRDGKITSVGRSLTAYPLSPRFAKMVAIGHQHKCIYLTVALVSALAIEDFFVSDNQLPKPVSKGEPSYEEGDDSNEEANEDERRRHNEAHHSLGAHDKQSDALKLLSALCAYMWAAKAKKAEEFCKSMFIRAKAAAEAHQLYQQLLNLVSLNNPGSVDSGCGVLHPPSKTQIAALKQIVAAGFIDQIAIRADLAPSPPDIARRPKRAIDVPYITLFPSHEGRSEDLTEFAVYLHPSSILAHSPVKDLPQYIVYKRLQRAPPAIDPAQGARKTRLHPLTPVTGIQLCALANGTSLLEYGKPIGKVEPVAGQADSRTAWVIPKLVGGSGGREWPLPALKTRQKKDKKGQWVVEKAVA